MKILQIVEESPSLDFTLPVFNELDNDTKIIILCSRPSYSYWFDHDPSKLLPKEKPNILFLDLISISQFRGLLKKLILKFTKNNRNNTNNFFTKSLRIIFTNILEKKFDFSLVLNSFDDEPIDLVLIDSRDDLRTNKIFKEVFDYIHTNNIKTIAVPVSTYVREGIEISVKPFNRSKNNTYPFNLLPSNFEFWTTTNQPNYFQQLKKQEYRMVGYSGLDKIWLDNFTSNKKSVNELNILLNIKHFTKNLKIQTNPGPYASEEVFEFFLNLKKLELTFPDYKFNFVLKPHYYMNFNVLTELLVESKINNFRILRTSIYRAIENIDLAIGLHTSVNIICSAASIPTILYPETQMGIIGSTDPKTIEMYSSHPGFSDNVDHFYNLFQNCLDSDFRTNLGTKSSKWCKQYFETNVLKEITKVLKT